METRQTTNLARGQSLAVKLSVLSASPIRAVQIERRRVSVKVYGGVWIAASVIRRLNSI